MLLLALQVAVRIAIGIPNISCSYDVSLHCNMQFHCKNGVLNVAKLAENKQVQVLEAVEWLLIPSCLMVT